jgi:hypothetical protein
MRGCYSVSAINVILFNAQNFIITTNTLANLTAHIPLHRCQCGRLKAGTSRLNRPSAPVVGEVAETKVPVA